MKFKNPISFLILFLLISVTCFSQSIVNRANSSYTVQDARLAAQYNLLTPRYADSTAANLQIGIDTCGAVVYLYSTHTFWYRSCASSTKKWVEIGSGGGGSGITIGSTTITSGTNTRVLYNNSGVAGEYSISGTGNVAMTTSPLFTTPRLNSTSTTGYVWTATDASGNGSFQILPSNNLLFDSLGAAGISPMTTWNNTLYARRISISGGSIDTTASGGLLITVTGTGDVIKVGTPINNQVGIWTGNGTIEGDPNFTFSSSTLNVGVAGSATGILTLSGVTSGIITIQPASAAGTYTLTLPTDDGTSNQFLQTNGSGVLTWATIAGGGDVTKVGTPVNDQVGVWTGDGTIEGPTTMTYTSDVLNLWDEAGIVVGSDLSANTRTNATSKFGGFAIPHYTNAEEPFVVIRGASTSTTNVVSIGGGYSPVFNSATSIDLYTAGTNTTLVGVRRANITNAKFHVNDALANYDFQITGDNDVNLFWADASADNIVIGAATGTDKLNVTGNINLAAAGNKLKITTGSNASIGTSAAMTAGSITISTTAVTASSIIFLTHASVGGTQGILSVGTITAGTSFVINSSSGTDTGTINWWIIN